MSQSMTQTPSLTRLFTVCLLSFSIFITPIAAVAARRVEAPRAQTSLPAARTSAAESFALPAPAPAPPLVPAITATMDDTFPVHPSGKAEPGDAITYDVNIQNTGTDATGVNFTDTIDPNTTLVAGSLKVSPLALPDSYNTNQDAPLNQVAPGVLANDTGLPAPTVAGVVGCADVTTPFVCTTTHGSVTLNADGSFSYTPTAGFAGTDTFDYTASNGFLPNDTATATITIADIAPTVSSTTPTNGATGVASNANVTVTFSEPVTASAGAFTISCGTSGAHTSVVTGGPTTFTINPNVDFTQGELCTATVVAAQIADNDANDPPDNMAANFVFSFTVDAAPTVTTTVPTDTATGVPTNTTITVNFSESVNATTSSFTVKCPAAGAALPYALSASPGTSFTLTPNAALPAGTTCQVTVLAAQITDVDSADPPDNMVANFVFNFTTDAAPTVNATTPTNGATQIANNTNVTVTFSEPVNVTGNWFQIVCATSGTHDTSNSVVTGGPTTFTINPTDFTNGELCTMTVFAAQVTDQDSNDPPDNMAANFVSTFTIDQAPSVTTTVPVNNATGVALNAAITVNFSETVNASLSSFTLNCAVAGARAFTLSSSPSSSFTLTPTGGLPAGDTCTVNVVANQITDTDTGDPPDNMVADSPFTFKVNPDAINDNLQTATGQSVIGNVSFNTAGIPYSITSNDVSATAFTVTAFDAASTNGGTVSVAANGQFTYNPPRGFEGADTFNYTISRSDGGGSDTATVTVTVSGMIWFIQNGAAACGINCGRLSNPYPTLAAFNTDNALAGGLNPDNNDNIFIYENASGYSGAVTLRSGQKLIGQDATATLASIAGVTVGSGSAALPAMNIGGNTSNITSTVTLNTNATVRGLSINSTTSTGMNDPAGAITGVSVSEVNVTTTTAAAVSLSSIAGTLSFQSINASAISGNGISVNGLTGSFTVTGSTNNLTSGGTITGGGTATRGAEFINVSAGVSLSHMTFTNATQVDGGSATVCGVDLINNDNTTCNAPIHMATVGTAVALNSISVNGSSQTGINGYDLRNLAMTNVTVTNAGNATNEHGVVLKNLRGTNTITSSIFTSNHSRQLYVINTIDDSPNATPTLSITSSTFSNSVDLQGALFDSYNSGSIVVNVGDDTVAGTNTFSNNFSNALQQSVGLGGDMTINIKHNTFNHKVSGIVLQAAGVGATSNLTYTIWNNTVVKTDLQTNNGSGAIIVSGTQQHQISGDIRGNIIGNGVAGSGAFCGGGCNGITVDHNDISAGGGGRHNVTIVGNIVRNVDSSGIRVVIGQKSKGNVVITGNLVRDPDNAPATTFAAIYVQGGIDPSSTSCLAATIGGPVNPGAWPSTTANAMNQILGSWDPLGFQSEIFIWRKGGTFNIPGLVGSTNTDVTNFVTASNNIPDATGADVTTTGGPFGNAASCPLLLAEGGVMAALNGPSLVSTLLLSSLSTSPITIEARRSTSVVSTLLNQSQLDSIVLAATTRWSVAGLTPQQVVTLRGIKFEVSDLSGSYLGEADGNRILVDRNARGKGWFVDANQQSDASFSRAVSATRLYTDPMNAAAGHVDLLTAIEHEMGHKLGLPDTYAAKDRDSLMYGYLTVGERRLPAPGQAKGLNPNALTGAHYLSLPSEIRGQKSEVRDQRSEVSRKANHTGSKLKTNHNAIVRATAPLAPVSGETVTRVIGTLPGGKTVHIQFQVTVNNPFPGGTTQVSNQGSVTASGPITVLTDDPGTGAPNDATITQISNCGAPIAVTNTNDSGAGSLRDAIAGACPGDTITFNIPTSDPGFSGGVYTISLTSNSLLIDKSLTINGPGANVLTVQRGLAAPAFRIFNITNGITVNLSGMTISNGDASGGNGGGIFSDRATITVTNCKFSQNSADTGGAIHSSGILGTANLTILNSTFTQNSATTGLGQGGAIYSQGDQSAGIANLTITGSTFNQNSAKEGGAIFSNGSGSGTANLTLINSTLSQNSATADGGCVLNTGLSGGTALAKIINSTFNENSAPLGQSGAIFNFITGGTATLQIGNTVLRKGAASGANLLNNGTITSLGHNISDDSAEGGSGTGPGGDLNQTGDQRNTDPLLGALAGNGGPTQTHLLLPGSPAIDAGDNALALDQNNAPLTTDQRGASFPRTVNSTVDMGAVEVNYSITATAGTPQSAAINTAFAIQLQATVTESGNPQSGVTVTFTAPASGASGTFPGSTLTATANTNGSGVATAPVFTANGLAGSYNVVASFGAGLPTATFVLTNGKVNQTINVTSHAPATAVYNTTFIVAATASSGLPVTFSSSGGCTNAGATFTMTSGTGTCTVKYDQAGDSTFNAAPQVTESVTAQKANQTITFGALGNKTFGDPDFTVSATSNAVPSLPVGFAVTGNCTVTGSGTGTVHLTGAGSCTITASQAGNGNYSPATNVPQTFNIAKAATTTAVSSSANPSGLSQSVTFTATVTSGAGTPTGTVQFKDNAVNLGSPQTLNGSGVASFTTSALTIGTHTITADYGGDVNFAVSTGTLAGGQVVNNQALISFSQPTYSVNESTGFLTVTVNRSGDTAPAVTVEYATDDTGAPASCGTVNGLASSRCDFTTAAGKLKFAAGETQKTFTVLVNGDSNVEGPELFNINLSNPTGGAALIAPSSAVITVTDGPAGPPANLIDDASFFVRQHYHDFLNREPDAPGLAFWTNQITSCGSDAACIEIKRINVSAAFFLSIEFQETGATAYLANKVAFGAVPSYARFERDSQALGRDYIFTAPGSAAILEANKVGYFNDFVNGSDFALIYGGLTNAQYVDALITNTGVSFTTTERDALVNGLNGSTETRATVLRKITEKPSFKQAEFNRAFVLMEYFGYLRRDPDAPGFNFWLNKLNQFNGNFIAAEMVKAFITSGEYRQRFGN